MVNVIQKAFRSTGHPTPNVRCRALPYKKNDLWAGEAAVGAACDLKRGARRNLGEGARHFRRRMGASNNSSLSNAAGDPAVTGSRPTCDQCHILAKNGGGKWERWNGQNEGDVFPDESEVECSWLG